VFSYTKKVTAVEGKTLTTFGPSLDCQHGQHAGFLPFVEASNAFMSPHLSYGIEDPAIRTLGVVHLETRPQNLVRIRD
jgi:hypothetical protein